MISSPGTLSTPGDFCVFSSRIASSTSARRIGVSAFSFCVDVPRMLSLFSVRSFRVLRSTRSISQVLPFFGKEGLFLSSMFDDRLENFLVRAFKME